MDGKLSNLVSALFYLNVLKNNKPMETSQTDKPIVLNDRIYYPILATLILTLIIELIIALFKY